MFGCCCHAQAELAFGRGSRFAEQQRLCQYGHQHNLVIPASPQSTSHTSLYSTPTSTHIPHNGHPTSLQHPLPRHPGQVAARADVCIPNPSPQLSPDHLDHHDDKSTSWANNINSTSQNPDDIVITLAIRTPLTKAKKGGFKDTPLDGLVFKILEQVVRKSRLDPQLVEDICLGNVCRTAGEQQYTTPTNNLQTGL